MTWCVLSRDENEEDKVIFKGWARMALPLQAFNVVEVRKPNVGQNKPASVRAEILLDTKRTPLLLHHCCHSQFSQEQAGSWKAEKLCCPIVITLPRCSYPVASKFLLLSQHWQLLQCARCSTTAVRVLAWGV